MRYPSYKKDDMSAVANITPHLSHIRAPAFLASKPIWLIWRFEHHDGEPKPRKVPYYANGAKRYGVQGRLEDRQQLVTFEAARAAAAKRGFSGIGHACLDGDFTVIDFDRCALDGKLNSAIEAMAANTYAEYSPSGEGIHLYALGNLHNNVKSIATPEQFGIELFSTKGFVTFTGNALEITDMMGNTDAVNEPGAELQALISLRFGDAPDELTAADQPPLGASLELIQEALDVLDPDMGHADWLKVGMALHHETDGEGFNLWDQWSAGGSKYPGEGNLRGRWDSFGRNPGKQVTLRSLIQLANSQGARISVNAISMEEFDALAEDVDTQSQASKPLVSQISPDINDYVPITEDTEPAPSPEPVKSKHRFPVIPAHQFAVQTSWRYIIKGVLPAAALGVLFGESGSGKSFIMLDMCIAIARGIMWRNLRTTQGRVVYLVAEGAAGFRNRLIAYARHHALDLSDIPLDIIDATPNLLLKEDALDVCKAILDTGSRPLLVVVDTFAQAMAGANENASEDMGKALAHCKGMHKALGSMILLVHHSGKDSSKGARGWSGLRAAADSEHEVTRTAFGRTLRSTKQKDGADFQEWGFGLEVVNIGTDPDGDTLTSCVVVEAEIPAVGSTRKLGKNETVILNVMSEIAMVQSAGIEVKEVIKQAVAMMPKPDEGKRDTRAQIARRALMKMCEEDDAPYMLEDDGTLTVL